MRHIVSISLSKQTYEVVEKVRFKVSPGKKIQKNPAVLILCCSSLVTWTWQLEKENRERDRQTEYRGEKSTESDLRNETAQPTVDPNDGCTVAVSKYFSAERHSAQP